MSAVIFAIAAIPAAVVVVVAATTRSRHATSAAALVAALLGAVTGDPMYTALDVGMVALATYFAWPALDPAAAIAKAKKRAARIRYRESAEFRVQRSQRNTRIAVVGMAALAASLLYFQLSQ